MRRLTVVVPTAIALASLSAAGFGVAGTAGAAAGTAAAKKSGITCSSLKGTISSTVTISKCSPSGGAGYKSATAPAVSLAEGGNITWKSSGATTTVGDSSVSDVTPNKCGTKGTEYSFKGKVTAASTKGTGIPAVGNSVKALACVSSAGAITLLPGTTIHL